MSEKKKVGLDIARSSTLVQEYQVASWERNELPTTPELTAIDEKIAKDPENAELHKERGLLLAGLDVITQGFGVANYYRMNGQEEKGVEMLKKVVYTAEHSKWYAAFGCLAARVDLKNIGQA